MASTLYALDGLVILTHPHVILDSVSREESVGAISLT